MPKTHPNRRPKAIAPRVRRLQVGIACDSKLIAEALRHALGIDAIVVGGPELDPYSADGHVTLVLVVASSASTVLRHSTCVRRLWPRAKSLAVDVPNNEEAILQCFSLGMDGVVLDSEGLEALADAVDCVLRGEKRLPPSVGSIDRLIPIGSRQRLPLARISTRERQLLDLLASGRQNKEIARDLGIELQTVKNGVSRLFRKLGVTSRADAARLAPPPPRARSTTFADGK